MFYNARWYDPYLNHFTQPDSIVPDPSNSQDWDRYSYARNNPVRYNDPSGHCSTRPEDDVDCWAMVHELYNDNGIVVNGADPHWTIKTLRTLKAVAVSYQDFIGKGNYDGTIRSVMIDVSDIGFPGETNPETGNITIDPDVFTNPAVFDDSLESEELFALTAAHELTHRWAIKSPGGEKLIAQSFGASTGWKLEEWETYWLNFNLFGWKIQVGRKHHELWKNPFTGPTWYSKESTNPIEDLAETTACTIIASPSCGIITTDREEWINNNMR